MAVEQLKKFADDHWLGVGGGSTYKQLLLRYFKGCCVKKIGGKI
jgi:hypothetical protein